MKEIQIDINIFEESIVKKAVNDYSKFSKIKTTKYDSYLLCSIESQISEDLVACEFENYLIELSQVRQ